MKHFCSLFLVSFLFGGSLHAQIPPPTFEWAKTFGSWDGEVVTGFGADDFGNVYIAGSFKDYICFDDTCLFTDPKETDDVYLAKYDSLGNLKWAKQIGTRKNDRGVHLEVSKEGDIYLGASFIDSIQLGEFKIYAEEFSGFYLTRMTSKGKFVWVQRLGDSGIKDMAFNERELAIGGVFLKPRLTFGEIVLTRNSDDDDGYIAKIDTSGKVLFAKAFGAKGSQIATVDHICLGDSGDIYMYGGSNDSLYFGEIKAGSPAGATRYLAGVDKDGKTKWIRTLYQDFIGHFISIKEIAQISKDRFVATGEFKGDYWIDSVKYLNENYYHYFTCGFNTKGERLWFNSYPGNFSIAEIFSNKKQFYVCGSASFSHFVFEDTVIDTRGTQDVFIVRHDSTGKVVWARLVESPADDGGTGVTGDSEGNLYVLGYFLDHNTLVDTITLSNSNPWASTSEAWIGRMSQDSFLLQLKLPEPEPPMIPNDWKVYPNPIKDTVYISGQFQSGILEVSLFDLKGSQIQNWDFFVNEEPIKLSLILNKISPGLYFLRLTQRDHQAVFKLVNRP